VQSVLSRIDAIEAMGIDPVAVSPAYWRTLGNRLSARLPLLAYTVESLSARLPLLAYTVERHAAVLAGKVLR